ncbi:hypothetical protein TRICI_005097 [Trichomonascus ciferrii]|uniref:F-box domain-containing protein n=1 Tax=Trichomonascus ciferrii TaxID=44093 RepID=A0A642V157_9ASCO|nr:hypothetical protein TRICI_005097 [Trichomonascus ciferrii]
MELRGLPIEIVLIICEYLGILDLLALRETCRVLNSVVAESKVPCCVVVLDPFSGDNIYLVMGDRRKINKGLKELYEGLLTCCFAFARKFTSKMRRMGLYFWLKRVVRIVTKLGPRSTEEYEMMEQRFLYNEMAYRWDLREQTSTMLALLRQVQPREVFILDLTSQSFDDSPIKFYPGLSDSNSRALISLVNKSALRFTAKIKLECSGPFTRREVVLGDKFTEIALFDLEDSKLLKKLSICKKLAGFSCQSSETGIYNFLGFVKTVAEIATLFIDFYDEDKSEQRGNLQLEDSTVTLWKLSNVHHLIYGDDISGTNLSQKPVCMVRGLTVETCSTNFMDIFNLPSLEHLHVIRYTSQTNIPQPTLDQITSLKLTVVEESIRLFTPILNS